MKPTQTETNDNSNKRIKDKIEEIGDEITKEIERLELINDPENKKEEIINLLIRTLNQERKEQKKMNKKLYKVIERIKEERIKEPMMMNSFPLSNDNKMNKEITGIEQYRTSMNNGQNNWREIYVKKDIKKDDIKEYDSLEIISKKVLSKEEILVNPLYKSFCEDGNINSIQVKRMNLYQYLQQIITFFKPSELFKEHITVKDYIIRMNMLENTLRVYYFNELLRLHSTFFTRVDEIRNTYFKGLENCTIELEKVEKTEDGHNEIFDLLKHFFEELNPLQ